MEVTTNQLVSVFIKLRNKRGELKRAFELQDEALQDKQRQVENELLRRAIEQNVTGFTAAAGTTYIAEQQHVSIADTDEFRAFVLEQGDLDFYEQRPSLGHVREYLNAHDGTLPPGIRMFRENRMRVRAPTKKKGAVNGDSSTAVGSND